MRHLLLYISITLLITASNSLVYAYKVLPEKDHYFAAIDAINNLDSKYLNQSLYKLKSKKKGIYKSMQVAIERKREIIHHKEENRWPVIMTQLAEGTVSALVVALGIYTLSSTVQHKDSTMKYGGTALAGTVTATALYYTVTLGEEGLSYNVHLKKQHKICTEMEEIVNDHKTMNLKS